MEISKVYNEFKELTPSKIHYYLDDELGLYEKYIEPINLELLKEEDNESIDRINILFRVILWDELFYNKYELETKRLLGTYKKQNLIDTIRFIIRNQEEYKCTYVVLNSILGRWSLLRDIILKEFLLESPQKTEDRQQNDSSNNVGGSTSKLDKENRSDNAKSIEEWPDIINLNIGKKYSLELKLVKGNEKLSSFYICTTPITQGQWYAIMQDECLLEKWCAMDENLCKYGRGDHYPIYGVSALECEAFIEELNACIEGFECTSITRDDNNQTSADEIIEAQNFIKQFRFALPSASQWEYAARGGRNKCKFEYSGSNNIDEVAWWNRNSGLQAHEVKTKKPNILGIYDMSGNIQEWCLNEKSRETYVLKGGSWMNSKDKCRINSSTYMYSGESSHSLIGFRLVFTLENK